MNNKLNLRLPVLIALLALLVFAAAVASTAADDLTPQAVDPPPYPIYLPLIHRSPCAGFTTSALARAALLKSSLTGYIVNPPACKIGLPADSPVITTGFIQADPIPTGRYLWVFVYAPSNRYYPQCINALTGQCGVDQAGNDWQVITYLGRAGVKERFQIVLVEINQTGQDYLVPKMMEWAAADSFPGLAESELAGFDVKEIHSIEVETAGN